MKVFINPTWTKKDKADGGIRRVSEAQWKYLPQFGIELVLNIHEADLIATHGTSQVNIAGKPIVNHNHGAYWDRYDWPDWAHEANKQVVAAMSQAVAHTAPSEWVANALRRGMLVYPEVIHHGVDPDEWVPPEDDWGQFVLWNKARSDLVSDPDDMQHLASLMPEIPFKTTIGNATPNVDVIGVMPIENMKGWIQHAGLYLCTARETFGIGTLEAMACGVPVVGWDWGGQQEIIRHGETGFLAKPYDYEALVEGVRWAIENRETLSANAREDVIARWTWEPRIFQYAELYKRTLEWWEEPNVKVSVIVTTHNLARYLDDCLDSVATQDFEDWECIVVDDASEDDPRSVFKHYGEISSRFTYVHSEDNLKLPGARNFGFKHAKGRYVIFLDADDMLAEHALVLLSEALDADSNIHIAAGHLDTISEDGSNRTRNSWPFTEYSWYGQMAHLNQISYSSMMRREVMERTGGYRDRHWRAEDAPLWIAATSFGFRAEKITEAATLIYRNRNDSKSKGEPGDGDWTSWFPWRMGFPTHTRDAFQSAQTRRHPRSDLVPWGAQGLPQDLRFWYVPDYTEPLVSVVIPVGEGHEKYVIDALDSLVAQTFQNWEAIVVNATGKLWPNGFDSPVAGAPWAKVVNAATKLKPAGARNLGASHANGNAILWLDADDLLLPHALEEMVSLHLGTGGLVYTSWLRSDGDPEKDLVLYEAPEFECGAVLNRMRHSMMCLVPREAHIESGGFDISLAGWEDWDYLIALQSLGVCSYKTSEPGFVYRFFHGSIREESFDKRKEILPVIREKWIDYYEGKKHMSCSKCPGGRKAALQQKGNPVPLVSAGSPDEMILLEYQGTRMGKVLIRGPVTNTYYTFQKGHQKFVMRSDADILLSRTKKGVSDFAIVAHEPTPQAAPAFTRPPVLEKAIDPIFPSMPVANVENMTVKVLEGSIGEADDKTIIEWLRQERDGKQRKGALKILEAEMNGRA